MEVFIDTDVILDLLVLREPFSKPAIELFNKIDQGAIRFSISATSVTNLYYILRKQASHRKVIRSLKTILSMGTVLPVTQEIIMEALNSDFSDVEDAVQVYCARQNWTITHLITRNVKHYRNTGLVVITPDQFNRTMH